MHLLLEVEAEKALSNTVDRLVSDLSDVLIDERIPFDRIERVASDKLLLEVLNPPLKNNSAYYSRTGFPTWKRLRLMKKRVLSPTPWDYGPRTRTTSENLP
jgi:hypothetical protein